MTPESRVCLNKIKRGGASSEAQFNNREAGMPSGLAAEFAESSLMESIMIDSVILNVYHCSSSVP